MSVFYCSLQYWHMYSAMYLHVTILDLCYTFPLISSFTIGETSEQFSKEKGAHIYYLHALRQITGCADHDSVPAPVMMRGRISAKVARAVANFLTIVSPTWTRMRGCGCACVRALARVALPRLELAICAVVKGNGRCERTLPQVVPDETGRERERERECTIDWKREKRKTFSMCVRIVPCNREPKLWLSRNDRALQFSIDTTPMMVLISRWWSRWHPLSLHSIRTMWNKGEFTIFGNKNMKEKLIVGILVFAEHFNVYSDLFNIFSTGDKVISNFSLSVQCKHTCAISWNSAV